MDYRRERYELLRWLDHRLVDELARQGAWVCGGAITSVFSGQRINDYDLYFPSTVSLNAVQDFLKKPEHGFAQKFVTESAVTFSDGRTRLQLITHPRFIGKSTPEEVFGLFDFSVCMAAFDFARWQFSFAEPFFRDLAAKRLVFNVNAPYPIASLWRLKKYLGRGYTLGAVDAIKLAMRIHSIDLSNRRTLKEHLLGVDTLFLKELTDKLGEEAEGDKPYEFHEFIQFMERVLEERFNGLKAGDADESDTEL